MPRVTITAPDETPQPYRFKLDIPLVKIGRSRENDIILNCGSSSSFHAEMKRVSGGFILQDLDSTNGISLNNESMEVIDLTDGMCVKLGDTEFHFQLSADEQVALEDEDFTPHGSGTAIPTPDVPQSPPVHKLPTAGASYTPPTYSPPSSSNPALFFGLTILALGIGFALRHYKVLEGLGI